jgi:hypothetical protein
VTVAGALDVANEPDLTESFAAADRPQAALVARHPDDAVGDREVEVGVLALRYHPGAGRDREVGAATRDRLELDSGERSGEPHGAEEGDRDHRHGRGRIDEEQAAQPRASTA